MKAADPMVLTAEQLRWVRLVGHRLTATDRASDVVEAVSAVGGLQAQVPSSPGLAGRARIDGFERRDLHTALVTGRTLVKSWLQRGTLHLVPSAELALYAAAVGSSVTRQETRLWERRGMPADRVDDVNRAVVDALAGGPATRMELADRVGAALGPPAGEIVGHPWGIGLKPAAASGLICFGAPDGAEVTFTRVDHWLGAWLRPWPEEQARAALLHRFLLANGPSTRRRFARWSGLPAGEVAGAWSALASDLQPASVDGDRCWFLAGERFPVDPEIPPVRMLPVFDAFTLAASEPSSVVDGDHAGEVFRKAGWISAVILAGGRAAGTWKLTAKGGTHQVAPSLFRPLTKPERAGLDAEIADVERFVAAGDGGDVD